MLRPHNPEYTFARRARAGVCARVVFNCVALTAGTMLKGSFTPVPTENDFLHHAFSQQLVRQTRNLA